MEIPKNFNELCTKLNNLYSFKSILCVNTPITGPFINVLFHNKQPSRIKYEPDKLEYVTDTLIKLNKKFDIICLDPYHEYRHSIENLNVLSSYLTETGIIVCHDCYPPDVSCIDKVYKKGAWCGVTFAALIEFAYNNPELYFAVINRDYGLVIISKTPIVFTKQILDNTKQKIFLEMFKESSESAFLYYKENAKDIINLIN